MANLHSFSLFLALFFYLTISFINCSSATTQIPSSSLTMASIQLKFWSKNVYNKMPKTILKKLSPLTKNECDYYSTMMSKNDTKFSADAKFCSLAKLVCTSVFDDTKTVKQVYTVTKTYSQSAAFNQEKIENEDPFSFFRLSSLKNGSLIHLPNLQDSLPDRSFLPSQLASKISLTYKKITQLFPQAGFGSMKKSIENTLSVCNATAIRGETKSCPRSLEEMIRFVKSTLGEKKIILSMTSKNNNGSNTEVLIKRIEKFNSTKIVACHEAFLPFAAYFCHSLSSTRLYRVELVDPKTSRDVNKMVAICHMDTSPWPSNHVAFHILKSKPGQGEACHWFTQLDLAWISAY